MNIQQRIDQFITEGGAARVELRDGIDGVVFLDENEFIPFGDLDYNDKLGFFQISRFPDQRGGGIHFSTLTYNVASSPDYRMWALLPDDDTDALLIGEWGAVVRAYHALKRLVESGQADEETDEYDERLGKPWLSISEASERFDVPIQTIQSAIYRHEIHHATQAKPGSPWRFPQSAFLSWLSHRPKPGPKPGR